MPGRGGGRPARGSTSEAGRGGGGVAGIGEEVESEAFQKQVKGEKYIWQVAVAGWLTGCCQSKNATGGEEEVSRFLLPEISLRC